MACSLQGTAQEYDHFIYIQSDNKQPFYVKTGGSTVAINSSSSGYLILPKIPVGSVSLVVGFPDNSFPEQHFVCTVPGGKDKGYLLKHFPDKGWALYDLQELTIIYAGRDSTQPAPAGQPAALVTDTASAARTTAGQAPAVSTPANTPASAAQTSAAPAAAAPVDTPVAGTPPPAPAAPVPATPDPVAADASGTAKTDTGSKDAFGDILVAVTNDPTLKNIKTAPKTPAVKTVVAPARHTPDSNAIALVSRQTTENGVQLVYTDRQASGNVDTVQVLLPGTTQNTAPASGGGAVPSAADTAQSAAAQTAPIQGGTDSGAAASSAAVPSPAVPSAATTMTSGTAVPATTAALAADTTQAFNPAALVKPGKNRDTSNYVVPVFKQGAGQASAPADTSLAAGFGVQPAPAASPILANTDCKRVAGDDDFLRLRKKLASENDVDKMMETAHKAFKKTCFTTEQVRGLSFLFLQEDDRYKFLEDAYPFVSDSGNFKTLQSLFTSAYFVNRFKALVQR